MFFFNGILASIWKQHRKLVSPYLGLGYVYGNLPVFNKHVNSLVESMGKFVSNELCDLRLIVNEATCNMILETTLGLNVDAKDRAAYSDYLVKYLLRKLCCLLMMIHF